MPVRDSPFPGMDPYLERPWEPVHAQLVTTASRMINRLVPPGLVARPEHRTAVQLDEVDAADAAEVRGYRPDVRVSQVPRPSAGGGGTLTLDAPYTLFADVEPAADRHVHIVSAGDGRLVTVVEFLSPANKTGRGLRRYLGKRADLLDAGVNIVEVDLVAAGDWEAVLDPHECPGGAVTRYRATVRLADDLSRVRLYPLPLREPLTPVPIPLRPADQPVWLDVQWLVGDTYAGDLYGQTIDYRRDPDPPLSADDAAWADALLRAAGRRV